MLTSKKFLLLFLFIPALATCNQTTGKVLSCDDPNICGQHGTCDDSTGNVVCICEHGYSGRFCDECETGFSSDGEGNCVQGTDCDTFCAAQGRVCDSDQGVDMSCGECLPGWFEENGKCIMACDAAHYEGELVQLDVYILLDRSASMRDDQKWSKTINAIKTFVNSSDTAGMGVGLQFFPVKPPPGTSIPSACTSDADCGLYGPCLPIMNQCNGSWASDSSCDPEDYLEPAVHIAQLPGVAGEMNSALDNESADGSATPIQPAMEGVFDYIVEYAQANPTHLVYLLLAADGMPTSCSYNSTSASADIAEELLNSEPSVPTYVFGVEDAENNLEGLNAIAAKGGTGSAILVGSDEAVTQTFIDMLNEIRAMALCKYQIPEPEGQTVDFDMVNVSITDPADPGASRTVFYVGSEENCDSMFGGWYYDDRDNPTIILLCPATCEYLNQNNRDIEILVGCETIVN